jgi:hypothetical protein
VPTRLIKLLAIAALVFAVVFATRSETPSTVTSAPVQVVKKDDDYNPHNTRIKPYKYERNQGRYTSESTRKPSTAPCAVVGADPAGWPQGIASCYGPAPAPKPAPAADPVPAAPAADTAPAAPHGGGTPRTPARDAKPAPSCG